MSHTRRNFIKTTGCLAIGFWLGKPDFAYPSPLAQELPPALRRYPDINAWIEIRSDGGVRVLTGKMELGQGIRTAVAQVAAEELNMDLSQVEVVLADTGRTPDEGYTAGSHSIESSAMAIRYAAAAARQKLLELAAQKMKLPVSELVIEKGIIRHPAGNRRIDLEELLAGRQLTDAIHLPVALKPKDQYRLVGKAVPRIAISHMVLGEPEYVQDLRFPGMVHGRVVRPPAYEASLLSFDEKAVRQEVTGILKIVVNGSFLAVIAGDEYTAIRAAEAMRHHAQWSGGAPLPEVAGAGLADYLQTLPVQTKRVSAKGNPAPPAGGSTVKARYFKPYLMHGSIGPSCAVARYDGDRLELWTHSQGVYPLQETLASLLHLPADRIHVKGVPGSGCYGHNGADDVAADAALLAMAYPGRHIRLQWSRDDEHAWEPYGSAMVMEVEAALDPSGQIDYWKYALWSDTHGTRPGGEAQNLLVSRYLKNPLTSRPSGYSGGAYRNAEPYYGIPNQQTDAHFFEGPLRVSSLRSLGAYANIFAIESFMDELAEKSGQDPYAFRLRHLDDERAQTVIRRLQSVTTGLEQPHTGMGMAFSRYKNSGAYCAVAAQVSVNAQNGQVQVHKMWAVVDAGEVINPDGLKNQIEGGMIQSASWTLQEEVRFDVHQVISRHWYSYPILRFSQVPEVAVTVLDHPAEEAFGAGEAAQGPAAAAIANAVYRAGGKRRRFLPLMNLTASP